LNSVFIAAASIAVVGIGTTPDLSDLPVKSLRSNQLRWYLDFEVVARIVPLGARAKTDCPWPIRTSVINLIATPERYGGKMVRVVGFLAVESEDVRLYFSEEDYRRNIVENGIFIDANREITSEIESKDLHYVQISGVFKMKGLPMHFPGGAGDAGITDVRQCFPIPELTDTRPRRLKDSQRQNPH
jgi:hypothetical protein